MFCVCVAFVIAPTHTRVFSRFLRCRQTLDACRQNMSFCRPRENRRWRILTTYVDRPGPTLNGESGALEEEARWCSWHSFTTVILRPKSSRFPFHSEVVARLSDGAQQAIELACIPATRLYIRALKTCSRQDGEIGSSPLVHGSGRVCGGAGGVGVAQRTHKPGILFFC